MTRDSSKLIPWTPMSDPVDIKYLGKFAEELNECGSAVARTLIQGLDGADPATGKINTDWLEDEIADVLANIDLVVERFTLDLRAIGQRKLEKVCFLFDLHNRTPTDNSEDQQ